MWDFDLNFAYLIITPLISALNVSHHILAFPNLIYVHIKVVIYTVAIKFDTFCVILFGGAT